MTTMEKVNRIFDRIHKLTHVGEYPYLDESEFNMIKI